MAATAVQEPEALNIVQVAQLMQCSDEHIRRLVKRGLFPKPIRLGDLLRWPRADLDEFLRSNFAAVNPARLAWQTVGVHG